MVKIFFYTRKCKMSLPKYALRCIPNDSPKARRRMPIPDLPKYLFWDWRYDRINWQACYLAVIARVIERGNQQHWQELFRYYGKQRVIFALEHQVAYLPDHTIAMVCEHFGFRHTEMYCYIRKEKRLRLLASAGNISSRYTKKR